MTQLMSQRILTLSGLLNPVLRFFAQSAYARRHTEAGICDFAVGNPHEMPPPAFAESLQRWAVPQHKDWYAYVDSTPTARAAVVAALQARRGVTYDPQDIHLTNGAFAGSPCISRVTVGVIESGLNLYIGRVRVCRVRPSDLRTKHTRRPL